MTPSWRADARCRTVESPDLFYDPARKAEAKLVCAGCPVRGDCLDDALTRREELGIWGGLTPTERDQHRFGVNERERGLVHVQVVKGASSVRDLSNRIGVDIDTVRRHLYRLERDGLVVVDRPGGGRLRIRPTVRREVS